VKLLDFGLSKMTLPAFDQTMATTTMTGWVMGTPAYMPPERLLNHAADGRSDVYSLGIIMFRMLSGEAPYRADAGGNYALAMMHLTSPTPSLRSFNSGVPDALDALVRRAMAKDPSDRPSASELAALLRQVVAPPGAAPAPGEPAR
jgi:serine/threonine protein kinase